MSLAAIGELAVVGINMMLGLGLSKDDVTVRAIHPVLNDRTFRALW